MSVFYCRRFLRNIKNPIQFIFILSFKATFEHCLFETFIINVKAIFENQKLILEFIDNGIPFNLLLKENPVLPDNIEETKTGGLGIFLTKQIADYIYYEYVDNENHLKIVKKVK